MEIDKKIIKKLIDVLEDLKKSTKGQANFSEVEIDADEDDGFTNIKSPLVGTAYLAPEPDAKPFVSKGQKIKKGDTVLIVEAMKTMNHVQSNENGEVIQICVNDGEAVEFDQILVKIK